MSRKFLTTTTSPDFYTGSGDPNTVVAAAPGSIYRNTSGGEDTTLYIKKTGTGNTGWVAVPTSVSGINCITTSPGGYPGLGPTDFWINTNLTDILIEIYQQFSYYMLATTNTVYAQDQLINTKTASYSLLTGTAGRLFLMNVGSANNFTLPQDSDQAFNIGQWVDVIQIGAGQTSFVAGTGATIRSTPGLKISAQYGRARAQKIQANTWSVSGDLSA